MNFDENSHFSVYLTPAFTIRGLRANLIWQKYAGRSLVHIVDEWHTGPNPRVLCNCNRWRISGWQDVTVPPRPIWHYVCPHHSLMNSHIFYMRGISSTPPLFKPYFCCILVARGWQECTMGGMMVARRCPTINTWFLHVSAPRRADSHVWCVATTCLIVRKHVRLVASMFDGWQACFKGGKMRPTPHSTDPWIFSLGAMFLKNSPFSQIWPLRKPILGGQLCLMGGKMWPSPSDPYNVAFMVSSNFKQLVNNSKCLHNLCLLNLDFMMLKRWWEIMYFVNHLSQWNMFAKLVICISNFSPFFHQRMYVFCFAFFTLFPGQKSSEKVSSFSPTLTQRKVSEIVVNVLMKKVLNFSAQLFCIFHLVSESIKF